MFFLMRCFHHPDMDQLRDEHRPAHRAWVKTGGDGLASVLIGSAVLDTDGTASGNFGILKAESLAAATAFAEGDPFAKNGIVQRISVEHLPDGFQEHRISEPMTAQL